MIKVCAICADDIHPTQRGVRLTFRSRRARWVTYHAHADCLLPVFDDRIRGAVDVADIPAEGET